MRTCEEGTRPPAMVMIGGGQAPFSQAILRDAAGLHVPGRRRVSTTRTEGWGIVWAVEWPSSAHGGFMGRLGAVRRVTV